MYPRVSYLILGKEQRIVLIIIQFIRVPLSWMDAINFDYYYWTNT